MFMAPVVGFKDVPDNYYYITKSGDVWRKKPNGNWKLCKKYVSKRGYWSTTLGNLQPRSSYKGYGVTIIRLMKLFIFKVDDPTVFINHIDGNKLNDNIENLELSNALHNTHHAIDMGLFKATKITDDIIKDIRNYAYENITNPDRLRVKYLAESRGITTISCTRILNGSIQNMNLENLHTAYVNYRTEEEWSSIRRDIKAGVPISRICKTYKIDFNVVKRMM